MNNQHTPDELAMADDLYSAMLMESPRLHRMVIRIFCAMIFAFIVWAYFANVDQVTRGNGKVIPSSQVQIIQSLDGGILEAMYVKEGMQVKKGQPLARIDDTRFLSDFAQQEDEVDSLNANITRLQHELKSITIDQNEPDWRKQVTMNTTPLQFSADLEKTEQHLVQQQKEEYQSRMAEFSNQLDILGRQVIQKEQESHTLTLQLSTLKNSLSLIHQELNMTIPMAKKGIVSEVDMLQLQRKVNDMKGERSKLYSQIEKAKSAQDETILKRQEAVLNYRKDVRQKINELSARLSRLTEAQVGAKDKVDKAVITSPVNGTIKSIKINTIGGVIKPGVDILEIVPTEDQLLIEAKIAPKDIAFLHPGLPAVVKVSAYNFTRYGGLKGTVENISADTSQDNKGNSYYIIKVRTKHSSLIKKDGTPMPIIPGMLTSVDVITGKRSILDYILNPILRAKDMAFQER
ncbi:HlyD family type I secretion periplasmic adaptor subunit [Photobacterium leiognathi]|uniref:HlyD family type I secretion periplasmic adaptor subunit n=1 Tax=Photobacterium leiognathi TaxID=553611 RepID=UPI00298220B1|nr:HlyD family type I secretion periplasmic adaptor subunit [Photobacterium leiognathi]